MVEMPAIDMDSMEMVNGSLPNDDWEEEEEDNKQLRESLDERHVNMITFSSVVGIGMFLQAGKIVVYAGPGLAVFAYIIVGTVMWSAIACLGEMTALFPVKGAVFVFPVRFLDEAVGYSVGWMAWFFYIMIVAAEVTAVSQLFNFQFSPQYLSDVGYPRSSLGWSFGQTTNPAVWATLLLTTILIFNLLPARAFGEFEYFFGCAKMIFICMLIFLNLAINTSSFGTNTPPHFKYYNEPYGFQSQNFTVEGHVISGGVGHLAGMWTAMTTCIFGMAGFDAVAITAAESKVLKENETVKLATRKISLRIILLYSLSTFMVGLNVPIDDQYLKSFVSSSLPNGQHSIFIIAVVRAHLTGWPHFINAFFIFSATSAGINGLFLASRLLHALASIPEAWPQWLVAETLRKKLQRTSHGVPLASVFACWLFGLLGFLAVKPYPSVILGRIATVSVTAALTVYAVTCASYLRFYKCIKVAATGADQRLELNSVAQKYNRDNYKVYPYKSHGQWLRAWYGLIGCTMMMIFNGWRCFVHPFDNASFVASYITIPVFLALILAYHIKFDGINPRQWKRRAFEDLSKPLSVTEKRPGFRKGQWRRENKEVLFCWENAKTFAEWIWVWLK